MPKRGSLAFPLQFLTIIFCFSQIISIQQTKVNGFRECPVDLSKCHPCDTNWLCRCNSFKKNMNLTCDNKTGLLNLYDGRTGGLMCPESKELSQCRFYHHNASDRQNFEMCFEAIRKDTCETILNLPSTDDGNKENIIKKPNITLHECPTDLYKCNKSSSLNYFCPSLGRNITIPCGSRNISAFFNQTTGLPLCPDVEIPPNECSSLATIKKAWCQRQVFLSSNSETNRNGRELSASDDPKTEKWTPRKIFLVVNLALLAVVLLGICAIIWLIPKVIRERRRSSSDTNNQTAENSVYAENQM
ncbi:uncharacterized protein LOC132195731 [Neocloeon triangulifer]|uniref:uncharacterized protein LOC132195731 n=1 Tax=Neocloeon triangulifer TaxID=2078957 RepID=UPI00286F8367|nr:uncharacterized protein LOC132195731 [Neocloeon triangulifer]